MREVPRSLFAVHIYEEIRTVWAWARARPNADHGQQAPGVSTLAALIDPAFRTSLQREEGRELQFTIVSMEPVPAQPGRIFVLKVPLGYSDRNLRKISGALDPATSALLVHVSSDSGEPQIWGFGYFGSNFLRGLPIGTGYESGWPENLMIRVTAPGIIAVARGTGSLGVVEFGSFVRAIPSPVYSKAMGDRLIELILNDPGYVKHGVYFWQDYNKTLERLLRTVNRIGHGATIVLVPPAYQSELIGRYHGGFVPVGTFQVAELLVLKLEASQNKQIDLTLFSAGLRERLSERIASIAKLACIDGALLLTTELEVIAFGAKLNADRWTGPVVVGPDGFEPNGQPFDLGKHGTRHGSAAAIVGQCDHVVAFVSSTDGPIRGFAKDQTKGRLLCWPDFRASMFTHDTF